MATKHTGGKSYRIVVAIPNDLYDAVEKQMKKRKLSTSEAVREALAAWVKQPQLAEGVQPGRPKSQNAE